MIIKSGQTNYPKVKCPTHGHSCPLNKLQTLRKTYLRDLTNYDKTMHNEGFRLNMGQFVKAIAESVAKIDKGELNAKEAWERLTPSNRNKKAKSECYEDTFLAEDLKKLKIKVDNTKQTLESSGSELVDYLKSEDLQKHLKEIHGKQYISAETAHKVYDLPPDASKNKILLIDHILAEVTDGLASVKAGQKFMEKLFDKNELEKLEAFSDAWDRIRKIKGAYDTAEKSMEGGAKQFLGELEAINRFVFNISSVITSRISKLVADGAVTSILKFADDEKLKPIFAFLDEKYGIKIMDMLMDRGEQFCKMADNAFALLAKGKTFKQSFKEMTDEVGKLPPESPGDYDTKAIAGSWFSLAMDLMALCMASSTFAKKMHKDEADVKDYLDIIQNAAGVLKSGTEIVQAYLNALAQNSDDMLIHGISATSPSRVASIVKGIGVATAVLSATISLIKAYEGYKDNDNEILYLNIINAGIALGAIPALIIGASSVTVVLAVVGVITTIIFYKIADPPVLNFLEKTVWSKQKPGAIKLENTIDGFYKSLYGSLEIAYYHNNEFKENSYFEIHYKGFDDKTILFIQITPKGIIDDNTKKQLVEKMRFPLSRAKPMSSIDDPGTPKVLKSHFWNDSRYRKYIRVYSIAQTWVNAGPHMKPGVKFLVEAAIDPSGRAGEDISKMSLKATLDDLDMDLSKEPVLWGRAYAAEKSKAFENPGKGNKVELTPDNVLKVNVYTRDAVDHFIRIHIKDGMIGRIGDYWSESVLITSDNEMRHIIPVKINNYWGTGTSVDIDVELVKENTVIKKENYGIWDLVKYGHL